MRKNVKNSTRNTWVKVIIICFVLLLIGVTIYLYKLYESIESTKFTQMEKTHSSVLESRIVDEIHHSYQFQDEHLYHIIFGTLHSEGEKIIFVPVTSDNEDPIIIDKDSILSEENIVDISKQDCEDCRFVRINPAMIQGEPLWEVILYDSKDRYVMDYLSMSDGKRYEQIRLIRKYKERS